MILAVIVASSLSASDTPVEPPVEKPKKPRLICHDEQEIGSMISKRVCRTPEQERALRDQSRDQVMQMQLGATHSNPSGH